MNIFLVVSLAILGIPFTFSNVHYYTAFFCRVIFLVVNNDVTEILHIPAAFGEKINSLPKQDIKWIASDNGNNNSIIKVSRTSNNGNNKKEAYFQNWNINFISLVIDSVSSVYRMFAALGLSFLAAIVIGITAARKPLASKVIIPLIDILQSVPILGFFPAAITFFITMFNGSIIGIELAAIFLIFTSMAWNMIFSVYESVLSIPPELLETSYAYRASGLMQLRRLYLPASIPKLIYNSITSWTAGWYFVTTAEIISLGSKTFTLRGLGSLLGNSVYSGHYIQAIAALAILVLIIMLTDFFFWRPLESYASRFKYDYSSSSTSGAIVHRRYLRILGMYIYNENIARLLFRNSTPFSLTHFLDYSANTKRRLIDVKSNSLVETLSKVVYCPNFQLFAVVHEWFSNNRNKRIVVDIVLPIIVLVVVLIILQNYVIIYKFFSALSNMYFSLYNEPNSIKIISQIPLALLLSYVRLSVAYLLALSWTVPFAIKIANNSKFERIIPLFQIFAAIPATAFFPFVIIAVNYVPGGFEFLSILLILTGMQWYILFNLIAGVRSIPRDIEETARAFRITKGQYVKRVLFPSIYPSFITGSITGWGGGWNSLIVAEYLVAGNKTYSVLGMGSILDKAAYNIGNTILILLIVGVMSAVIVMINRLVWRRLYGKVIRKYGTNV
jgi:NitT/TauT family transport system permease protein